VDADVYADVDLDLYAVVDAVADAVVCMYGEPTSDVQAPLRT